MKNLVVFFCDINGTIEGFKKNSKTDYKEFNVLLKKLKEKDEADVFLFSLVSTENKDIVSECNNTLRGYLDEKITMGRQYYDFGYLEANKPNSSITGKVGQIVTYLNELKETYHIKKIYFADDLELTPSIVWELLEHENKERFEPIIPINKDGLSELNSLIITKFFVPAQNKIMYKKA